MQIPKDIKEKIEKEAKRYPLFVKENPNISNRLIVKEFLTSLLNRYEYQGKLTDPEWDKLLEFLKECLKPIQNEMKNNKQKDYQRIKQKAAYKETTIKRSIAELLNRYDPGANESRWVYRVLEENLTTLSGNTNQRAAAAKSTSSKRGASAGASASASASAGMTHASKRQKKVHPNQ